MSLVLGSPSPSLPPANKIEELALPIHPVAGIEAEPRCERVSLLPSPHAGGGGGGGGGALPFEARKGAAVEIKKVVRTIVAHHVPKRPNRSRNFQIR